MENRGYETFVAHGLGLLVIATCGGMAMAQASPYPAEDEEDHERC
jgi:hypothetical protein